MILPVFQSWMTVRAAASVLGIPPFFSLPVFFATRAKKPMQSVDLNFGIV